MEINQASRSSSSELAVFSPKLALKSATEIALRQWFVKFCVIAEREFHRTFIDLWCEALNDIEVEWVEFGCRAYLKGMKFFPKPGDIRDLIDREKENRLSTKRAAEMEQEFAQRQREVQPKAFPSYECARAAGEKYRREMSCLVAAPSARSCSVKMEPEPIIATDDRLALLDQQAREATVRCGGQK